MSWSSTPLPHNWDKIRARILKRDPRCRINGPRCTVATTEVDHIYGRGSHDDRNLQGVCASCHRDKTNMEAAAARRRMWGKAKRSSEQHPGVTGG